MRAHLSTLLLGFGLGFPSGVAQGADFDEEKNQPGDLIQVNIPEGVAFRLDLSSHYGAGFAASFRLGDEKHFALAPVAVANMFLGGAGRFAGDEDAVAIGGGFWFGLGSARPGVPEDLGNTLGGYLVVHELVASEPGDQVTAFTSARSVRIGFGRRRAALSDFTFVLGDDEELVRQWALHMSSTVPISKDFYITQFTDVAFGNDTAPALFVQGIAVGSEI